MGLATDRLKFHVSPQSLPNHRTKFATIISGLGNLRECLHGVSEKCIPPCPGIYHPYHSTHGIYRDNRGFLDSCQSVCRECQTTYTCMYIPAIRCLRVCVEAKKRASTQHAHTITAIIIKTKPAHKLIIIVSAISPPFIRCNQLRSAYIFLHLTKAPSTGRHGGREN